MGDDFSFTPLGDLPGDGFGSDARDVSADGAVVVGGANLSGDTQAFRWTSTEGIGGLGSLPEASNSYAFGVSADGSTIVGTTAGSFPIGFTEAFRWTNANGMIGIGRSSTGASVAVDVSGDGSVIVGSLSDMAGTEAFRWTAATGLVRLGDLAGGIFRSDALSVSDDGRVIVGRSESSLGREAFRWTTGEGMIGLGDLPGGIFESEAYAVSTDGSVVVGVSNSGSVGEAFRWTNDGGMVGLGDLPGGRFFSVAYGVSGNGSVVVGEASSDSGAEAFVWTAAGGVQSVRDLLLAGGATGLTGWTLENAWAISADGRTIVGNGGNPAGQREAWVATIPEPDASTLLLLGLSALSTIACLRRQSIKTLQRRWLHEPDCTVTTRTSVRG